MSEREINSASLPWRKHWISAPPHPRLFHLDIQPLPTLFPLPSDRAWGLDARARRVWLQGRRPRPQGYTLRRCPMSWSRLAACWRWESSLSGSMPKRRDGLFSSCSRVKYHRLLLFFLSPSIVLQPEGSGGGCKHFPASPKRRHTSAVRGQLRRDELPLKGGRLGCDRLPQRRDS